MRKAKLLLTLSALAIAATSAPACAWDTGYDGPFSFLFRKYGDDMYQPAITPDRPYWHGDSAVPPAMRWHDREIEVVDEYGNTVATRVPRLGIVAADVDAARLPPVPVPVRVYAGRTRRAKMIVARRFYQPAGVATTRPTVPVPTEH